jgi:predicted O-linked N-acetylglucosamine transferase (SPINDLY family)
MTDQPQFAERIVHLPDGFMPGIAAGEEPARPPTRAECGLPDTGFVFCCFNSGAKYAPVVFDIWMRLLQAVPGSVLWLADGHPAMRANLAREAAARGVAAERIVFAPPLQGMPEHLARLRMADLFLDTLPQNGQMTVSDALFAGVPTVTCAGTTFAGQTASSLLNAAGLGELVTRDLAAYEALALRLATDPALCGDVRRRLATGRITAPLFDAARFTRNLEAAFTRMWEIRCAGRPPESFAVAAEP